MKKVFNGKDLKFPVLSDKMMISIKESYLEKMEHGSDNRDVVYVCALFLYH